ncbi:MAG: DUF1854 domain-containing protein [Nitrospiraceae bacterium]|nr:DUF1854 domain-containing protein [Nitrospiraceae bacterium]
MTETKPDKGYMPADLPVDPARIQVGRDADGQFRARWDGHSAVVRVTRCFPWTDAGRHISLRDDDDDEVALVTQLDELDDESRTMVERALAEAAFVLEITRVDALDEEFEIRQWKVQTKQGARTFQTRRDEWPRRVGDHGLLVREVAGDLFYIDNPEALDSASRRLLSVFLD